jgi:hypothetical protein
MSQIQEQLRQLSTTEIKQHLAVDRYGDFVLTSAIRPWVERQVIPREGYRLERYQDDDSDYEVPTLAAAVSQDRLFDLFLELLDQLGDVVDVVIESHHQRKGGPRHHYEKIREHMDLPILKSHCFDFEDLLIDDGCFSMAVIDPSGPCEIQFDDHKLLVVYAKDLAPFQRLFESYGVRRDDHIKLINEGEHLHSTLPEYADRFDAFAYVLGID